MENRSCYEIEPKERDFVIAKMTDDQISTLALEAAKVRASKFGHYNGYYDEGSIIHDYAAFIVIYNELRAKYKEKLEENEKAMGNLTAKEVSPTTFMDNSAMTVNDVLNSGNEYTIDSGYGPVR